MTPTTRRRTWLLLKNLLPQLVVVTAGLWFLDDLARRPRGTLRKNLSSLEAMANLHSSLTDAERATLFAVIQGEHLHPDTPAAFRMCIDRARQECRAELASASVPGERPEAERLAAQVEEVSRRGEVLLAAPAGERLGRYNHPDTGFQVAVTAAWRHLSKIRVMNEVAVETNDLVAGDDTRRAAIIFGCLSAPSLLLSAFMAWRRPRAISGPAPAANTATATTAVAGEARHAEPGAAADGGGMRRFPGS